MTPFKNVLIANRGEIAIRIARALDDLGIASTAVYSQDDRGSLHVRRAGAAVALPGSGPAAYLDMAALMDAAQAAGCDAVHPGYGFLSENAAFAAGCKGRGLHFVGPSPQVLELFGDKLRARSFAVECAVPVVPGLMDTADLQEVRAFRESLGPDAVLILKAVSGGGGRGIRIVRAQDSLDEAWERCSSEALKSFGNAGVYVEQYLPNARHIEVQIIGDGVAVTSLWERECTLQRQHQKVIEIAPSPGLDPGLRERLIGDAVRMTGQAGYRGLGTVEFLVWQQADGSLRHAFIETNPRIQVEHTVTEAITGVDLVQAQLCVAAGASLADLHLDTPPPVRGFALQARVNMEQQRADGSVQPCSGRLRVFEPPSGPGVRVDTFGYAGYVTSARFDSLLAKVIVHEPQDDFPALLRRAVRALLEFRIEGVPTNTAWLVGLLQRPEVAAGQVHTRFVDEHAPELVAAAAALAVPLAAEAELQAGDSPPAGDDFPEEDDPGLVALGASIQGVVISIEVEEGAQVAQGAALMVLEAMKMEHVITAPASGLVSRVRVRVGDAVAQDQCLLHFLPGDEGASSGALAGAAADVLAIRPDLQEVLDRRRLGRDEARPEAFERRRQRGLRSARENIADLCDAGTFTEFGQLVVAAQRARRSFDDLARNTPGDGIVTGMGSINGDLFTPEQTRCAILAYDATVLAGTQGRESHRKCSRMFRLADELKLPVVLYAEGGGGRPGDTEKPGENTTFHQIARLSGKVPLVGVLAGYCFAGNAALLGCCDVIIATESASLGMGGPAMVEGGGLGVFGPGEIGPARMHHRTGVVDILVRDEAQATAMAKRYLAYFQGRVEPGACPDQRLLRSALPADRRRAYDVRRVIELLADEGSVLELRAAFGRSMVTALVRIQGRAVGVLANNPAHLGGAVDADAADKGARFLQLCDTFRIPVLQLCDTPGVMVGPDAEKTALVRHSSRLLMAGANLRVPAFTIILRKAYGLGMVAMMGGALKAPLFNVAWPTGEYGAMGLEGAVRLGYRKELEAIADPRERQAHYEKRLATLYEDGKALNKSSSFDFDDVIDPAESRTWVLAALVASDRTRQADDRSAHAFITPW
ncbi:MAG: carboxyl transferase domain-containing protein [Burkholderiaceae bacterium]|nr:carboxyl transferase domain-containing protein [Burkholderiaceae bacterium]